MREFKGLQNLHGVVHISKLNNVEDIKDVVMAGFKYKEYLEGLALEWEAIGKLDDEKVLDAIEAHKNLKSLTIKGYGGKRLSDWIVGVSPSFNAMVSLCIYYCFHLEVLPSLGNLPFLKHLTMQRLDRVESFGEEFYGDIDTNSFRSLEKLTIAGMKALKTWCFPRVAFQVLEDLQIQGCPELTKIPYCFPSLSHLLIQSCDNVVKFEMCGEEGSSSITAYRHPFKYIRIYSSCHEVEEIPNSFANSDGFHIDYCRKFLSIPRLKYVRKVRLRSDYGVSSSPVEATALQECRDEVLEELTIDSSLNDLFGAEIHHISSLKSLGLIIPRICSEDEDGELMTRMPPNLSDFTIHGGMSLHVNPEIITELSKLNSLTKLGFSDYALESFPDVQLPSTLKSLTVWHCSALRTIPDRFLSGCSKSLQVLQIMDCPNLECLPSTLSTLESLQTLHIYSCDRIHRWPSLSSISGPHYLTNLSDLEIYECGALECLPEGCHKATALHTLRIRKCPNLCVREAFGFPANLRILQITDCVKMKPFVTTVLPTLTSLTHLVLRGFPDITTLDHCLPEFIQTLTIWEFPRLKSLAGALPKLKNLTRLTVQGCPLVDPKSWS